MYLIICLEISKWHIMNIPIYSFNFPDIYSIGCKIKILYLNWSKKNNKNESQQAIKLIKKLS